MLRIHQSFFLEGPLQAVGSMGRPLCIWDELCGSLSWGLRADILVYHCCFLSHGW